VLENLKKEWREFREAEPGERFKAYHQRVKRASTGSRVARIALGLVLAAAGIVMLFVPGPGILFIVFGLACFGGESKWIAGGLDAGELRRARDGTGPRRSGATCRPGVGCWESRLWSLWSGPSASACGS